MRGALIFDGSTQRIKSGADIKAIGFSIVPHLEGKGLSKKDAWAAVYNYKDYNNYGRTFIESNAELIALWVYNNYKKTKHGDLTKWRR